jgi:hypothetical protein
VHDGSSLPALIALRLIVSFLKVTIFSYNCAAAVLAAYGSIGERDLGQLKPWFLSLTVAVLLLSLPTLVSGKAYAVGNSADLRNLCGPSI